MRLTRIEAHNLKGQTFEHNLAPLQLVLGDNFKGKTAVIEAVRLALLGYIPEIGKQNSSTWELSSHDAMRVFASFDDTDKTIERKWYLAGQKLATSKNTTDAFDAAMAELPLLNSEHYFGLTDKQRVEYVFSKVTLPDDYTVGGIVARLQRISFDEEHSEAVETGKQEAITTVRNALARGINEGLAHGKEELATRFTYWNKREKETKGTVAILAELKNRESEVSTDKIRALEAEISGAQAELGRLNEERGKATAARSAWANIKGRRDGIDAFLKTPPVDHSSRIKALREEIAAADKELAGAPSRTVVNDALNELRDAQADETRLEGSLAASRTTIASIEKQITNLETDKECPHCHSKGKNWKASLRHTLDVALGSGQASSATNQENLEKAVAARKKAQQSVKSLSDKKAKADETSASRARWAQELQTSEWAQQSDADKRAQSKKELETLNLNVDGAISDDALAELTTKRDGTALNLSTLTGRKQQAIKLQQDLKRAAEAALEHETAAAHVMTVKAVGKELTAIQGEMVDRVFGELLATANTFVEGIMLSPIAFHGGEVGRWAGSKFIPHRVFSGTEKALTYVAIAAALSSQAPFKLLILDEIGRLDRKNAPKVLARLAMAQGTGVVDQVIVAGTTVPDDIYPGWDVIQL